MRMTRTTMPVELRRAHQANDKAVMQAYGFWGSVKTESDCVARLMEMYAGMTKKTKTPTRTQENTAKRSANEKDKRAPTE